MPVIEVSDRETIDFKYNLRVYFGFLKKYKMTSVFLVLLVFLLSVLDLAFNFVIFKLILDLATRFINHQIKAESFYPLLTIYFGILLGIPFIRSAGRWHYLRSINLLETDLITDIKRYYFNHLLGLSHGFHASHKTGSLISRLSRGSGAVETMTDVIIFQILPLFFKLILVSFSIIYFTYTVGLVVLITTVTYILYSLVLNESSGGPMPFTTICRISKKPISVMFLQILIPSNILRKKTR